MRSQILYRAAQVCCCDSLALIQSNDVTQIVMTTNMSGTIQTDHAVYVLAVSVLFCATEAMPKFADTMIVWCCMLAGAVHELME